MNSTVKSKYSIVRGIMPLIRFSRRVIPDIPDWVLSGLLWVFLVWLIVLSVGISQLAVGRDLDNPTWNLFIRPLYASSLFFLEWLLSVIEINATFQSAFSWLAEHNMFLIPCLMLSSPVYFVIGALFSTKRKDLGITLLILNTVVGCFFTFLLIIAAD